jgi:hypothetical protein
VNRPLRVGIYVHHHGGGHASRAKAIGAALAGRGVEVTYLTSLPATGLEGLDLVSLPLDTDFGDAGEDAETVPIELHFAPLRSRGLGRRMASIAGWIAESDPDLMLVDVSVEVAMLARLCGTPFAYVRQSGRRDDPPHQLAYGWAAGLLAPFFEWQEVGWASAWIRGRTGYVGAVTRFDGESRPALTERGRRVLVLGEGTTEIAPTLTTAAPDWEVLVAGAGGIDPDAVDLELLASCAVVVAPAGANTVAEAAFACSGLVCLPRERPFGEQLARGAELEHVGAAVVCYEPPRGSEWPAFLEEAVRRRGALAALADGGGAARSALYLEGLAAGSSRSELSSQRTSPAAASSSSQPVAGHSPQRSR